MKMELWNRITNFADSLTVEDLVGNSRLNGVSEEDRTSGAVKGAPSYCAPPEYGAVEALEDLRQAIRDEDHVAALAPYYRLKKMLNW